MRIHLTTTPNKNVVPFDYQQKLVGTLYKWLGEYSNVHGAISLYSFSWLQQGIMRNGGFDFPNGARWFISFYNEDVIKNIIKTILHDPQMFAGMVVTDITIEETPDLSNREIFYVASPIFIKRFIEDSGNKLEQFTFNDSEANDLMKQTLIHKMKEANVPVDSTLDIRFDLSYSKKKLKLISYKGVKNKASICPIIIEGKPETKEFAWNVGIGNSTGIGFGAIY
jgi:CRISPR-associated endoribonuclease Cas6